MTNVLKFRAWHKELKMMAKVYELDLICDELTSASVFYKILEKYQCNCENCNCKHMQENEKWETWDGESIELMQWTGLYEAKENGREIYEGDILRDNITGYTFSVKYSLSYGISKFVKNPTHCGEGQSASDMDCAVIIGNIYENPELLE